MHIYPALSCAALQATARLPAVSHPDSLPVVLIKVDEAGRLRMITAQRQLGASPHTTATPTEESWPVTLDASPSCARMFLASTLPSSTPIWSYELMPQIAPWTWNLCSASSASPVRFVRPAGLAWPPQPPTVKRNQAAERLGRELLEQDRVGGLVARKDFALDERLVLGLFGAELFADLLLGLSKGERPAKR